MYPIKQSLLMTKYANLVISGESGLPIASTLLGTPTIQLMTAASIINHGSEFPNDYSLQSPIECSPCHKGSYEYIGCSRFTYLGLLYPKCIQFNSEVVIERMNEVYDNDRVTQKTVATKMSAVQ